MLSDKLGGVVTMLELAIAGNAQLSPGTLRAMRTVLQGAQATARSYEATRVPAAQRLTLEDLQDGKIALLPVVARPRFDVIDGGRTE